MAKYSFEFKKQIVDEHLRGEGSYRFLARKYNVPAKCNVENWVANYRMWGTKGYCKAEKKKFILSKRS